MKFRKKKQELSKKIAAERIERLFDLAEKNAGTHPERTQRYVSLARLIAMRYRVPLGAENKRRLCKYCYTYLAPGNNCRMRLKNGCLVTTCLACGRQMHYPLKPKPETPARRRKGRYGEKTESDTEKKNENNE